MTTQNWMFPITNPDTAGFRAWGSDLSAKLALVGLVQTADTGQIDWSTVTRPALANTMAGYEIWRYPDSTVFIKFEFGNGPNATNCPGMLISVGTGSDGAGALTGPVTAAKQIHSSITNNLTSPGTNRQSLMVYKDGFFGFLGYLGAASTGSWFFVAIAPTVDANGVKTNDGLCVYYRNSSGANSIADVQAINLDTSTVGSVVTTGTYAFVPYGITASLTGADTQTFLNWMVLPSASVRPVMQIVTVISSEFPTSNTFQTDVIGVTPRTYIALDTTSNGAVTGTSTYKFAMLWE